MASKIKKNEDTIAVLDDQQEAEVATSAELLATNSVPTAM